MQRYDFERTINASPQACFDLFSDLDKVQEHSSEVIEITKTNDKGFEPGMTFTCTRQMMGKAHTETLEVAQVDPGTSYTMECDSCGALWTSRYFFEPAGDATRVRMEMWSKPRTLVAKVMSPVMGLVFSGMVKKSINKELDELKAACEGGGVPDSAPTVGTT